MAERWSKMEGRLKPSRSLEERLRDHPELQDKIESLLAVVENAAGDVEKAAAAERRFRPGWGGTPRSMRSATAPHGLPIR